MYEEGKSKRKQERFPPALYEKAPRGVSNNNLKKEKGKSEKAKVRLRPLLIK
jgi:hypothetical protein